MIAKDRGTTVLGSLVRGFWGIFRGLRLGWGLSRGGGTRAGRGDEEVLLAGISVGLFSDFLPEFW